MSLRAIEPWEAELQRDLEVYVGTKGSLEAAMNGLEKWFEHRANASGRAFERWLAPAMILGVLAGLSDAATASPQRHPGTATSRAVAGGDTENAVSFGPRIRPLRLSVSVVNAISGGFDVHFQEAIDDFRDKGVVTPEVFAALELAAKARAFSVAGLTDQYALDRIKESLQRAIEEGTPANQWLTALEDEFNAAGLSGIQDQAFHMRAVYRANVFGAYNAGRRVQQQRTKLARPYLQRISVAHGLPEGIQEAQYNVRPEHAELDGVIRPVDDPFWTANYPPYVDGEFEYGCRCMAVSVSREEMEAEGLEETPDGDLKVPDEDQPDAAERFFVGSDKLKVGAAGKEALLALLED